jgi:hypothetical protein
MGVAYGPSAKLIDNFDSLDLSKWNIHGESFGTVNANSGTLTISNTLGGASDFIGISTIQTFPVGSSLSVSSRSGSGRHHSLIGFGSSPFPPYPHGATGGSAVPGLTWYARADNLSSTMSWRNENGTTGVYDSATENLTGQQIFRITRVSSSTVQFWRNNILEYTATGLVLANDYSVYFSNDGLIKPNISEINWVSVA